MIFSIIIKSRNSRKADKIYLTRIGCGRGDRISYLEMFNLACGVHVFGERFHLRGGLKTVR